MREMAKNSRSKLHGVGPHAQRDPEQENNRYHQARLLTTSPLHL